MYTYLYQLSIAKACLNMETREMKVHIQLNLLIVAALYLLWGLLLFVGQQQAHPLLSNGPYDAMTSSMFAASLFAFVVLFVIALLNPMKELVYASVAALAFLALASLYQLFLSGGMPQNPTTFFGMLISATVAAILFFSMTQTPKAPETGPQVAADRGRRTVRKTRSAKPTRRTGASKRRVTKSPTKARTRKKKTSVARRKRG
jgi:hypothetical protein